ncbi:hypothetical protein L486_01932 [Kwoniella mangroviensis CBS 10435]|uniref:Uncharacterized protein n=1 Tax=Kwoniella mangroviensis CBS 10435 TaxID=1331196 RepID=A0A1B9J3M0_9TREE|nr:hypothetical protein L486_01932 [Kwoniella mangroviensis CBS 10435]
MSDHSDQEDYDPLRDSQFFDWDAATYTVSPQVCAATDTTHPEDVVASTYQGDHQYTSGSSSSAVQYRKHDKRPDQLTRIHRTTDRTIVPSFENWSSQTPYREPGWKMDTYPKLSEEENRILGSRILVPKKDGTFYEHYNVCTGPSHDRIYPKGITRSHQGAFSRETGIDWLTQTCTSRADCMESLRGLLNAKDIAKIRNIRTEKNMGDTDKKNSGTKRVRSSMTEEEEYQEAVAKIHRDH